MAVGGNDDTLAGTLHGVAPPAIAPEPAPRIAQRYTILRLLGGGGMGRVYEVRDEELGERVALKVLHGGITDEALERFRREVRLTRKIQHRNVARMFDIGDHDGAKFLTMELVVGDSLGRVVASGAPLAWPKLRAAATQIAAGLAAAHACGVVHRDLKPDNVLVEAATGRYVITDFGIARGGDDPNVTQVGTVVGTPRYMAPEQLAGAETDARADVFSLGVMLYELASGQRPWGGDNPIAIAVAQATQPVRPLVVDGLPPTFVGVVMQCLAIDPALRPADAQVVVDRLAELALVPEGAPRAAVATPPLGIAAAAPTAPSTITRATTSYRPHVETSLAVLPVTCAPTDAYLADGLQEDLVDSLSTLPHVRVRPAGMARGLVDIDVRAIGARLEVEQIVTASLRRTPAGLRVAARLISVADGFQIWAHRADCAEAEILAQSEVLARGIAGALSSRAAVAARPPDPAAVDLYLRARAELRQFWGKHALAARALLEDAARLAPESPPILGALAYASVQAWVMVAEPGLLAPARDAVARGLALDHGEAHLASAILKINNGDSLGAAADLRTALARAPMSAQTHEYAGKLLVELGPIDAGRHHFQTAIGLDPGRAALIASDLARVAVLVGEPDEAARQLALLDGSPDESLQQLGAVFHARIDGWRGGGDGGPVRLAAQRIASRFGGNAIELLGLVHATHDGSPLDRAAWDATVARFVGEAQPRRLMVLALQLIAETAAAAHRDATDDVVFSAIDHACRIGLIDLVWLDRCPLFARFRADLRWLEVRGRIAAHAEAVLAALVG